MVQFTHAVGLFVLGIVTQRAAAVTKTDHVFEARDHYCGENAVVYGYTEQPTVGWVSGKCFNFAAGASSWAWTHVEMSCTVYNAKNCGGSSFYSYDQGQIWDGTKWTNSCVGDNTGAGAYCCRNSPINWLYSAICVDPRV
jgi:hypothetical protein